MHPSDCAELAAEIEPVPPSASQPLTIVGIGAAAGGFDSLVSFLRKFPADTGMVVLVVQHLYPDAPGQLAALLQNVTAMEVVQISDAQPVRANCVHVIPPKFDVKLEGGKLRLHHHQRASGLHQPIDGLFFSLAREVRERAVGIIFSGGGSDGSRGVRQIKEHGGITFAESRKTARFFGMPQSAIATGAIDEVLTPAAMARRLEQLGRQPALPETAGESDPSPDDALQRIFALLKSSTGVNFSNYKQSTLLRRITRRIGLGRVESIEEYAALLKRSPKELEAIYNDLLINVTGFFRDRSVFQALKRSVLPRLIEAKVPGQALRIWVPGCASGQEVYSLAMITLEVLHQLKTDLPVQIFGTDLSEAALAKARTGFYPLSIAKEVGVARLRRFFLRKSDGYQINRNVREICTFARQNLCEDPPFSRLDLLSCRNVLIYFGAGLQRKCIPVFYYSLNPSGVLVLGNSETIGGFADLFALADKKNKVYTKKVTPLVRPSLVLSGRHRVEVPSNQEILKPSTFPRERDSNTEIQRAADQLILTHFAPCGVVIDARMQVWHFRGHTSNYLEHAPGIASLNLLKMVRPELAADLSTAVHQALKSGSVVRKDGILSKEGGLTRHSSLEVIPFMVPPSTERWLLIIFQAQNHVLQIAAGGKGRAKEIESAYAREFERMRLELASTKESLQAIIEEQEATNEELKAANEEIESSNEELQSANEELETAKEELQSTNEELTTVNDELNSRNLEISEINDDLNNLLSSINLAIVMVDHSLTIRRTTPLSEKLFNIIPTDVGRRLRDINPNLDFPDLVPMVQKVVDDLTPREREVRDDGGRWYSLRVRPYRTRDNVIDGAVITLVDIHGLQQAADGRRFPAVPSS